ncbi:Scr1 family TA system antitoxin-like transcriptional regulator [Streptomyces sp. NPDC091281]|uniref:helix-turn-helix domain-containing protein n=1 Tax=Streptomyces sp. NPDC091281 TaxID=3365985 RepID=UPI0037F7B768
MVVSGEPEPSDSLRTFGAVVQALREFHGLSREEFARRVGYSKHTVASVELGRRKPDIDLVEEAEKVLGNTGALRASAPYLMRRPGLAAWFREWAKLEEQAIALYTYECRLIPGLLQPEPYARALFRNHLPPMAGDQVEANWVERTKRQRLLAERPNTAFGFILEEHLFRRGLGGRDVSLELIDHVLRIGELWNVEVQIMPVEQDEHSGLHGPMRLLETPENKHYAYCEGQESGHLVADRQVVSTLQMRYARMRSQALPPKDSRSLLQRMRGDL